jgi:hypothetical protein
VKPKRTILGPGSVAQGRVCAALWLFRGVRPASIRRRNRAERGYALLFAVFLAAILLVSAMAASLSVVTDGKRQKEKEMIWRGKQYVRAIKLFYRKNGRFPADLDDLSKPKIGSIRFLRQTYKDPMNKADGTWRFIYVGPSGQLIGSLKPHPLLQLPTPATPPASAGASATTSGFGSATPSPGTPPALGTAPGTPSAPGTAPGSAAGTPGDASSGQSGQSNQPGQPDLPPGNVDSPTVFGGKIIGVGSKIDRRSIIVYDKAKNYRLFEFIWDPSKDTGGSSQPLQSIPGGSQPGQPGQTSQPGFGQPGFGQPPVNPNPTPTPPPTQQN